MTENECRRLVRKHMLNMMRALGVSGWTIDVSYGEIDNEGNPKGFSNQMELSAHYRYEKALVGINPDKIRDEKEFLRCIRHELIHVALSPFTDYDNYLRKYVGEQPSGTWDAIEAAWQQHIERAVLNVERMIDWGLGLTPEKLITIAARRWEERPKKKKKRRKKR